ncbi:MAG: hypothetical protein EZS28_014836 [Streblomastix strix]|uniref:Protein kinase domain-containing protein n=1 Tax=Streblomastix strix TaxID=222440 RepID=A0A5J4W472_9EUKA|nr:MAG: hypothetical protein EZS28_014836 [Streblomastix strix]
MFKPQSAAPNTIGELQILGLINIHQINQSVYLATHPDFGNVCTIVRDHATFNKNEWEFISNLTKEQIECKFLVKYLGLSKTASFFVLFTEYYGEKNLEDYAVSNTFKIKEDETAIVIGNILEAVNELHKKKLTHGNLKLSNIFFKEVAPDKSIAVVTNLSSVKLQGEKLKNPPKIPIQFQPPEVLQGQPYTPQSDLYMIGLIMYGMLFGKIPYTTDNPQALLQEQQSGPQGLDSLSLGFNSVLCTLLAFDPNQRTSCEQILQQCPIFFKQVDLQFYLDNPQLAIQQHNQRIYNRGISTIPSHILAQPQLKLQPMEPLVQSLNMNTTQLLPQLPIKPQLMGPPTSHIMDYWVQPGATPKLKKAASPKQSSVPVPASQDTYGYTICCESLLVRY